MAQVQLPNPKSFFRWVHGNPFKWLLVGVAQPRAQELPKPRLPKPRWHYLYYLLAVFDLLAISASLSLNHQITAIYARSVAVNQAWTNRLHHYSELDQLAAAVNAPGNDVFDSHNVMAESAKTAIALSRFYGQTAAIRRDLKNNVNVAQAVPLLKDLDDLDTAMTLMVSEASQIFAYFRHDQPEQAGRRMATMDRNYTQVHRILNRLSSHVGDIQQQVTAQQSLEVDALKQYEVVIAAFIAIMIVSVTIYGHKLAQQVQATVEEQDRSFQQLQQAEASLREQTTQLEYSFSELQAMQARLVESEKMSALGVMVAGVAHEINNPVNFIHGNLQHAAEYSRDLLELIRLYQEQYPSAGSQIQEKIDDIDIDFIERDLPKLLSSMQIGTDRIREIVKSLRNFSRLDEAEFKAADLHEGLDSTLMILNNRLKEQPDFPGVTIIKDYGNLPQVDCYPGQLNQVFMNILSNAIDALEETSQRCASHSANDTLEETVHRNAPQNDSALRTPNSTPTITIRTEVLTHNTVAIRITDNGSGIPEHVRSKIFNPFFTTKSVGKGTGLGLSISYKIVVTNHAGRLLCYSKLGQGTEFAIEIPISQPEPSPFASYPSTKALEAMAMT